MSYLENHLLVNEEILYRAKQHWIVFVLPSFLFITGLIFLTQHSTLILLGFLFLIIAFVQWFAALFVYLSSEFALTNKRVIAKAGVLRHRSIETLLSRVATIKVEQNPLGRLFNYGTITIQNAGGTHEYLHRVENPLRFRQKVQAQIEGN